MSGKGFFSGSIFWQQAVGDKNTVINSEAKNEARNDNIKNIEFDFKKWQKPDSQKPT